MNIKQFFSARQFSQSTERTYRFSLTRMKAWLKENGLRLDKLEATQVDDFLSAQKWNHNSRYTAYCGLRSYLRRAYGDSHPALEYRMKRQQSKPQRTLTTTQLQRVIAILQGKT
ncbi:MAG: site-specific integrase, partial [Gammaproteobacteria bacterium]|nr:site-specific integrase [Gammaproteobacteria bacterium]